MKIAALLLALPLNFAVAQQPDKPNVIKIPGQPVKAIWSNGDEAELKWSRSPMIKVPVPFQVTENLCAPETGAIITITFPVRPDRMAWYWSKHHNPAQLGKVVHFKFGPFEDDLLRYSFASNSYQFNHADLVLGLPKDTIEFTDLKWLPGFADGTLKPFTISTWQSEAMVVSGQTGLSENRIVSGANNVHVSPLGPFIGEIDLIESGFVHPVSQESFALLGDVVSWMWQNEHGPCLIAFKPNLGAAQAVLFQYISTLNDPFQPYLWQQDTLLGTIETAFIEEELWYVEH